MESKDLADDLDLEFFSNHKTTWSHFSSRRSRNKTYGRTANQKKEARRRKKTNATITTTTTKNNNNNNTINTNTNTTTTNNSTTKIFDEVPVFNGRTPVGKQEHNFFTNHESSSSLSSFEPPARPEASKRLTRSRSLTGVQRIPMNNSSRSVSSDASFLLTIDSEFDLENRNPNAGILTPPQLKKTTNKTQILSPMDEHPKLRPRKVRHIHDVGDLANSFSSLAKSSRACTWNDDDFHADENPLSIPSPATSEVSSTLGSSRKRGICCSLDISVIEGGTKGSRSRIFSLDSDFVQPLKDEASSQHQGRRMATQIDSDDALTSESDTSFNCNDMSCDQSADDFVLEPSTQDRASNSDDGSTDGKLLPPIVQRSCTLNKVEKAVIGASSSIVQRDKSSSITPRRILDSMPSAKDLRFLLRSLRNEERNGCSFGYSSNWSVTLPNKWDSNRRLGLIRWACSKLEFTTRAGGGNCLFMSLPPGKGKDLLAKLEEAYLLWKDQQQQEQQQQQQDEVHKKPTELRRTTGGPAGMVFCIEASIQTQPSPLTSVANNVRRHKSNIFDDSLAEAISTLDISGDKLEETYVEEEHINDGIVLTEGVAEEESSNDECAKFVRNVTMEHMPSCSQSFDEEDVFDLLPPKPARFSGEHHVGGADLVSHLHGLSPAPSIRSRKPPKLTIPGARLSGGLSITSPFPRSTGGSLFPSGCVETPQLKRGFWESNNNSQDWGVSKGCSQDVIDTLMERLEAVVEEADPDLSESFDELPLDVSPRYSSVIKASVFAKADLGFEYEVVEDSEDDNETADSNVDDEIEDDVDITTRLTPKWRRRSSVGTNALTGLKLDELKQDLVDNKAIRRKRESMAKHKRVSLCVKSCRNPTPMTSGLRLSFLTDNYKPTTESTLPLSGNASFSFLQGQLALGEMESKGKDLEQHEDFAHSVGHDESILRRFFSFLGEEELLCRTSLVSVKWADVSRDAHAALMVVSVGYGEDENDDEDDEMDEEKQFLSSSVEKSMEKSWKYLVNQYPWACFLSEGAFKRVYKVWNVSTQAVEAMSVMDVNLIESTGNKKVVATELAVSAVLSSLVRRSICPNFVLTRRVFTCPHEPPPTHWGNATNKKPKGSSYVPRNRCKKPREPSQNKSGKFQYMRMELCNEGDAEEYIKRLPDERMDPHDARQMLFQIAFGLHVAADQFSLKHYDIKLLNIFVQTSSSEEEQTVLRYGLGSHIFSLKTANSLIAKVADYGTAIMEVESNGQPATIGQFTTLENTPPEFMILGDAAKQGHGHDAFGLGLCMLHLHTGHAPYEEILENVRCPSGLKDKLQRIWEDEQSPGYSVIRSVILADTYVDENGDVQGEADEVLYDTLYRYLVLFGVPENKFKMKEGGKVWKAISFCLEGNLDTAGRSKTNKRKGKTKKQTVDQQQFEADQKEYSIQTGSNKYIARARKSLEDAGGGGLDLLLSLVNFDPEKRASACEVLNSKFMSSLREVQGTTYTGYDVKNYMAYATN